MSVHALATAILLCNPSLPKATASAYAGILQNEADLHGFSAMDAAALICHESRWVASARSADGEDYGLGQIRARYVGPCRLDPDPIRRPSPGCAAEKQRLLDPGDNLRQMAGMIVRWKRLCRTKTGRSGLREWLTGYAGASSPSQGQYCGVLRGQLLPLPKKVQQVLCYRRALGLRRTPTNCR